MSTAKQAFDVRIRDASDLLEHFDSAARPPHAIDEVLKRACLVMTLTAFEGYVRDRLSDAVDQKYAEARNSWLTGVYTDALAKDLKGFHLVAAKNVQDMFTRHLSIDVAKGWTWQNVDSAQACTALDDLARFRRGAANGAPPQSDPIRAVVTRAELGEHIQFVRNLVLATERFLASEL